MIGKYRKYKKAQSALYDFLLFIPILIVALVILAISYNTSYSTINSNNVSIQYSQETLNSFLESTVNYTYYSTSTGAVVVQRDISEKNVMLLTLYLLTCGQSNVNKQSLSPKIVNSLEYVINITLYNLTYPQFKYYIQFNTTSCGVSANVYLGDKPYSNSLVITSSEYIPPNYNYLNENGALVILAIWNSR